MKVHYEFELGLISRDSKGHIQDREPLHYCPKTELKSLIEDLKDHKKEGQEFDLDLIRWTTDFDWGFDADREELKLHPQRSTSFKYVGVPKYIDKIISKVLREVT